MSAKKHAPCPVCGAPTADGQYLNEALLDQTLVLVRMRAALTWYAEAGDFDKAVDCGDRAVAALKTGTES